MLMTQTEPHHWQIQALGALRVDAGAGLQPLRRAGSRRLLALLLISRATPRTRETLADALWPELPGDQARRRLTDARYELRRTLPEGALLTKAATLQLDPTLAVDLWAFRIWAGSADPSAWAAAVAIYQGEALPEVYDDWALGPRAQPDP
ncbi:MAG: AfsR/SARP family transcriptional regulator [Oscillochloridaceae bacterium umkhey_bin13]